MVACLLGSAGALRAADEAPVTTAATILDRLYNRDATLNDFVSKLTLTSTNSRTGEQKIFIGQVQYRKKDGQTQLYVRFDMQKDDTGAMIDKNLQHDIVMDGRWLIDSDGRNRKFTKQELVPPGNSYNPFKIGQGPIPLPIGQPKEEIMARFNVTLIPQTDKDPVNTAHLKLVPINERYEQIYKMVQLDLWVDLANDLPTKVVRTEPGEPADDGTRDTTSVLLKELQVNSGDARIPVMATPAAGSGWEIAIESYKEK